MLGVFAALFVGLLFMWLGFVSAENAAMKEDVKAGVLAVILLLVAMLLMLLAGSEADRRIDTAVEQISINIQDAPSVEVKQQIDTIYLKVKYDED